MSTLAFVILCIILCLLALLIGGVLLLAWVAARAGHYRRTGK